MSPSPLLEEVDAAVCRSSGWSPRGAAGSRLRARSAGDRAGRGRGARRRVASEWLALRAARRSTSSASAARPARAQPAAYAVSQRRALPRVPVQVFRRPRAAAAGRARRRSVDDAAGARTVRPRGVLRVLHRVAGARARRDHDGERRRGGRAVRRGRRDGSSTRCPKGIARSSARCCSARRRRPASASARSASKIEDGRTGV